MHNKYSLFMVTCATTQITFYIVDFIYINQKEAQTWNVHILETVFMQDEGIQLCHRLRENTCITFYWEATIRPNCSSCWWPWNDPASVPVGNRWPAPEGGKTLNEGSGARGLTLFAGYVCLLYMFAVWWICLVRVEFSSTCSPCSVFFSTLFFVEGTGSLVL